jgi:hypothetical protein
MTFLKVKDPDDLLMLDKKSIEDSHPGIIIRNPTNSRGGPQELFASKGWKPLNKYFW